MREFADSGKVLLTLYRSLGSNLSVWIPQALTPPLPHPAQSGGERRKGDRSRCQRGLRVRAKCANIRIVRDLQLCWVSERVGLEGKQALQNHQTPGKRGI